MKAACALTVALACGGAPPPPGSQPARAPDPAVGTLAAPKPDFSPTPAARVVGAWFDAFNSGDEARIREFAARYRYPAPDGLVALRAQIGELQLVTLGLGFEVEASFVVKDKHGPAQLAGWLQVTKTEPPVLDVFALEPIPPGTDIGEAMATAKQHANDVLARRRN